MRPSSCRKHDFGSADFEKRFVEILHAQIVSRHKFAFRQFSSSSSQTKNFDPITHPRRKRVAKKSPPTPKNPFRLPPPSKIYLRTVAAVVAPYCHGKSEREREHIGYQKSVNYEWRNSQAKGVRGNAICAQRERDWG